MTAVRKGNVQPLAQRRAPLADLVGLDRDVNGTG